MGSYGGGFTIKADPQVLSRAAPRTACDLNQALGRLRPAPEWANWK